jgi:hypothetical protein
LLGSTDRLQVLGYRRRLDEIVRKKFYPAAATRGSLHHRRRADGLCVLDLRGADSHLQSNLWRRGDRLPPGGLPDDLCHRLGGPFCSLRDLWCQLLHWHSRRDVTTFSACQQNDKYISTYDYSSWNSAASRRVLTFDYTRLRQRRFDSRGLGRGLGIGSGLLDGRRDFFRHR